LDGTQALARGLMSLSASPRGNEIYVEFVSQGAFVKATAIDSVTRTEASVIGPTGAPRGTLADAAVRKLNFVLKKLRDDR
jgi:hypothetical protein